MAAENVQDWMTAHFSVFGRIDASVVNVEAAERAAVEVGKSSGLSDAFSDAMGRVNEAARQCAEVVAHARDDLPPMPDTMAQAIWEDFLLERYEWAMNIAVAAKNVNAEQLAASKHHGETANALLSSLKDALAEVWPQE